MTTETPGIVKALTGLGPLGGAVLGLRFAGNEPLFLTAQPQLPDQIALVLAAPCGEPVAAPGDRS